MEKASNVLSHPNSNVSNTGRERALLKAEFCFEEECYHWLENEQKRKFYLCHRLDSATSGLIVGSIEKNVSFELKKMFREHKIKKKYLAVTSGFLQFDKGVWKDSLVKKKIKGKIRVQRGKEVNSITKFKRIRNQSGGLNLNLIELYPITGKTHQLRVQCMLRKVPIVGDKTYGDFAVNQRVQKATKLKRLCLHSSKIEFTIQSKGEEITVNVESPLPRPIGRLLI